VVLGGKGLLPLKVTVTEPAPAGIVIPVAVSWPRPVTFPVMLAPVSAVDETGLTLKVAVALIELPASNTDE
jgi:hypothetical protein